MKNLIKLLAVAAPLAISMNASAETFTVADANVGGPFVHTYSLADSFDAGTGFFHDHLIFTLTSAATITATASSTATAILLNTGNPDYNFIGADFDNPLSLSTFLSAGSYQLDFKSTTGAFTGTLAVAAVPEPETYALMLAGLALVGFSARRRQA